MPTVDRTRWPALAGYITRDIPPVARLILERAWRDCEIAETPPGSNHGARIEAYLRRAGVPASVIAAREGYWCAAWLGAVWQDAGATVPPDYAAVRNWVPWAKAHGLWLAADATPREGCAVIYAADGKPPSHIGLVTRWDQWYRRSLEGNTTSDGFSREGTLTAFKSIAQHRVVGYVRPQEAP